ncbi:hypothetical protein BWQ96_10879 [Gracilariopsis chorda]|uniref:Uncharacterized protein n=1 Tax=Gracilariopsis chorda TaxID=448386 RepID=A0A2V3IBE6_9FLOR|nr:hypothetical protein BWQ96_10879 [Gracilariopsis chorda]|eukprot:PXF39436.1 hypothetical protein BWQ96_10879 [Gracilariopsis chorda]
MAHTSKSASNLSQYLFPESYQLPILSYHNAMPYRAVLSQIVALHNTYYGVATLEIEKAGLHNAYSEFNIRSRWDALLDQVNYHSSCPPSTRSKSSSRILRDMEQCGMDDAGDFLAGELGEDPGTLNLLIMLLKLINGTPSEADLSEQLQQAVSRWMNYRFRHSPSVISC